MSYQCPTCDGKGSVMVPLTDVNGEIDMAPFPCLDCSGGTIGECADCGGPLEDHEDRFGCVEASDHHCGRCLSLEPSDTP